MVFGRWGVSESMRIDSSGNLLVNTTTNTHGGLAHQAAIVYPGGGTKFGLALRAQEDDTQAVTFVNASNVVNGSISVSASTTAYNTSSDYRLKEDVQPMTDAIARLNALKPINFAWKVDGSRTDGFLAHEAQAVVPEAVTGTKDAVDKDGKPQYQGIDQSKLVPLLTAALQDAIKRIEQLESQINSGV
jgi:hypothetical protein